MINGGKVEITCQLVLFQVVNFFYVACTATNFTQNKRYFFMSHPFHSSHLIHVEEMKTD